MEAEGFELPAGYRFELGGTVDQEAEVRADLIAPLPMIVVFMAAILILTFRSTLLAGVPGRDRHLFGRAGGPLDLADRLPVSFNTFMGTFGLIGVALNDSIVVMAEIRSNPGSGG